MQIFLGALRVNFACWVIFMLLLSSADFFSKLTFSGTLTSAKGFESRSGRQSDDNLCKQFGSRSGLIEHQSDLDPNLLTL